MEELIKRIMTAAGIDESLAQKAVAIILGFLEKEGPSDQVQQIFASLPGASELVAAHSGDAGGGGLLGGLGSMMGGGMGAMATLNELTSAGLSMGDVQTVAKELISFAKENAGDDVVDEVISQIPGLNQIV